MQPRPKRVPHDVYHGHTGRRADGADATGTRPGCGVRLAGIVVCREVCAPRGGDRLVQQRWVVVSTHYHQGRTIGCGGAGPDPWPGRAPHRSGGHYCAGLPAEYDLSYSGFLASWEGF